MAVAMRRPRPSRPGRQRPPRPEVRLGDLAFMESTEAQALIDDAFRPLRHNRAWIMLLAGDGSDTSDMVDPSRWPDEAVTRIAAAPADGAAVVLRLPPPAGEGGVAAILVTARRVQHGRRRLLLLAARREETALDAAAERAVALGQLLASIVHELNNQLSTILAQSQLLSRTVRSQAHRGRLERVIEAARQSARIVTNLLDLARRRPVHRAALPLAEVTAQAVELVRGRLEQAGVELAADLPAELPAVIGDATGLRQVVVNLLVNAGDALAEVPGPRHLWLTLAHDPDGRMVELRVADNGPGIPAAILKRIFQPFFTTKPEGKGTGLGLSLCVTQVKELGGSITAANRPAGGAEFVVRLPIAQPAQPEPPPVPRPAGGAAVLVIDDDAGLGRYIQSLLRGEGHAADLAADGVEALRRIDRRRYDLIVADIHMPGMDGVELYRRLESQDPEAARRMLFMTGDIANAELEQFFLLAGRPVIAKPFDDDRFLSVVSQLLRRPTA